MVLKAGNGAMVLVIGNTARKVFRGPGADMMFARERDGHALAAQCPVWGSYALPVRFGRYRIAVAAAGETLESGKAAVLCEFVEDRVVAALAAGSPRSGAEVLPMAALRDVLGGADPLIAQILEVLRDVTLPSGPTHGDLHRGNLLLVEGEIRVIDFDRFRSDGCPLFDLLHFKLSEAQRGTGTPWLEVLCAHPELVQRSTMELIDPDALFVAYAMQRIALEGQSALIQGRSLEKYRRQAERTIAHLAGCRCKADTA